MRQQCRHRLCGRRQADLLDGGAQTLEHVHRRLDQRQHRGIDMLAQIGVGDTDRAARDPCIEVGNIVGDRHADHWSGRAGLRRQWRRAARRQSPTVRVDRAKVIG